MINSSAGREHDLNLRYGNSGGCSGEDNGSNGSNCTGSFDCGNSGCRRFRRNCLSNNDSVTILQGLFQTYFTLSVNLSRNLSRPFENQATERAPRVNKFK